MDFREVQITVIMLHVWEIIYLCEYCNTKIIINEINFGSDLQKFHKYLGFEHSESDFSPQLIIGRCRLSALLVEEFPFHLKK